MNFFPSLAFHPPSVAKVLASPSWAQILSSVPYLACQQSNHYIAPLFAHRSLWWYAEDAGKLKYGRGENFCSHTSIGPQHRWCSTGGWLYIVMFPEVLMYTRNSSILIPTTFTFCQVTPNFQELTHMALCHAAKIWVSSLYKEWL